MRSELRSVSVKEGGIEPAEAEFFSTFQCTKLHHLCCMSAAD